MTSTAKFLSTSCRLPWLVTTLALNSPGVPDATAIWSTARFGQSARLVRGGEVTVRAGTLDLGRNLRSSRASFVLYGNATTGIGIRNLDTVLGDGQAHRVGHHHAAGRACVHRRRRRAARRASLGA